MKSVGFYGFLIGASTTSNIVRETCQQIWEKLQYVFPTPSEDMWKSTSDEFFLEWDFPNCLGAIDGKHVVIQAFPNHNSLTYNYKHTHSLVLMAVADAHYKFIMVDIGALGHNSDGGVFKNSKFGNSILHHPQNMKIPGEKVLPNTNEIAPFVFLADEAFPLRKNIMRPYPGRNVTNLPQKELIFNKRLSKARRVVENAFGILSSRFRIYRKPIIASKETAINIVKATVCLHNWLRDKSASNYLNADEVEEDSELDITRIGLQPILSSRSNHASQDAMTVRNIFTNYFESFPE
ncbi:protein ALP1-like [Rhagoletis pomonella]|uniref:protein ALP1-like n=1 Tax=Rhagoletis pomonella TaxID=28610 RepID=UPI00178526D0|nr:protein ALP1-like [Rhagoletis pomonella]